MGSWINLSKNRYFTADDMRAISNNFQYLKEYLAGLNIPINELRDVSISQDISPVLILEKFNDVEYNIQVIESVVNKYLGFKNCYFKNYQWQGNENDFKSDIYRWIDWLNELKSYDFQFVDLFDINNELIFDINDEPIQVLEILKGVV